MFGFINSLRGYPDTMIKVIRQQNKIGFKGFFQKVMFEHMPFYLKNASEKAALQLITPQQSIFTLVRESHEEICISLLELIYNKKMENYRSDTGSFRDVANCIKLGNIYVKEHDYDLDPKDYTRKKKNVLNTILYKIQRKPARYFWIFVPKNFNRYQYDELMKIIEIRNQYKEIFGEDVIGLFYYFDNENLEQRNSYEGEDVKKFLYEEALNYIREVEVVPNEQIIVDTFRNKADTASKKNAPFVKRADTEPVVATSSDKLTQGNLSETLNADNITPGETDPLR